MDKRRTVLQADLRARSRSGSNPVGQEPKDNTSASNQGSPGCWAHSTFGNNPDFQVCLVRSTFGKTRDSRECSDHSTSGNSLAAQGHRSTFGTSLLAGCSKHRTQSSDHSTSEGDQVGTSQPSDEEDPEPLWVSLQKENQKPSFRPNKF
eukprot:RCo036783